MAKRMKEKKEERLATKDRRPRATASFVRMAPSKVARVLDGIRGKKYTEALAILDKHYSLSGVLGGRAT